jgi:hypothetical protein
MTTTQQLSSADMKAFEPEAKIGILATLDEREQPHISLITSLQAKTPTQLMWGQFIEGRSKNHVRADPRVAFVVMNAARQLWRGKARWTHETAEGGDYERFNQMPMFRYNSYLGIHTVHYMDLVALDARTQVSLPRVALGLAIAGFAAMTAAPSTNEPVLTSWARGHLSKPTTLSFVAYRDDDGFPVLIPVVPCRAVDGRRLVFAPTVYRKELLALRSGTTVAVFGLSLDMESVLIRGTFTGYTGPLGAVVLGVGTIGIEWVYNSMPPLPGIVYPREPLRPVTDFS